MVGEVCRRRRDEGARALACVYSGGGRLVAAGGTAIDVLMLIVALIDAVGVIVVVGEAIRIAVEMDAVRWRIRIRRSDRDGRRAHEQRRR